MLSVAAAMTKPVRVLMLEDNATDAELIRQELVRSGLATVSERVDSEQTFASALREFLPDIVLSDHSWGVRRSIRAVAAS